VWGPIDILLGCGVRNAGSSMIRHLISSGWCARTDLSTRVLEVRTKLGILWMVHVVHMWTTMRQQLLVERSSFVKVT
jgi:hypothetical protein